MSWYSKQNKIFSKLECINKAYSEISWCANEKFGWLKYLKLSSTKIQLILTLLIKTKIIKLIWFID